MLTKFDEQAQKAIVVGESIAFDLGHNNVGSEHLLLSLLKISDSKLRELVKKYDVDDKNIYEDIKRLFGTNDDQPFYMEYSDAVKSILEAAMEITNQQNKSKVTLNILTIALLQSEESVAHELLKKYKVDFEEIIYQLNESSELETKLDQIQSLVNLNKKVKQGEHLIVGRQKELEKQNLQSELKLLKNQLNPHFLFNALNNIDSLIRSDPEKASKSLVQMSDMMRYMIYETNVPEVYFRQELDYIKNYLALQRLQYDNPELVSYVLEGEAGDICIAPMLFIPFIENAFKHCTDKKAKEAICFHFQIHSSEILFTASNLYDPLKRMNKDSSTGIGLSTVKRRLDFLYAGRYNLRINEENGYFGVSLICCAGI